MKWYKHIIWWKHNGNCFTVTKVPYLRTFIQEAFVSVSVSVISTVVVGEKNNMQSELINRESGLEKTFVLSNCT